MTTPKIFLHLFLLPILALSALQTAEAESVNARGVISWSGVGKIVQIDADQPVFHGELDGVIYIETSEGEMDEAFVECAGEQHLQYQGGDTKFDGKCLIIQSTEDTISAEFECSGEFGACKGVFTLTAGTGKFAGISGSSSMILRSPLRHLAINMESAERLVVPHGAILLPDLSYRINEGGQ